MFLPFLPFALLVALAPVIVFFDGPAVRAIAAAAASLAMAAVAVFVRAGEGRHLAKLIRPWTSLMALPALYMVIQSLPIPIASLAHPIWTSAAAGLNRPIVGAISIDPGTSLIAVGHYVFAIAVVCVAAAVTIDRRRAEWTFSMLAGATIIMAGSLPLMSAIGYRPDANVAATLGAAGAIGVVISVAAVLHAAERLEMHRDQTRSFRTKLAFALVAALAGCVVCGFVVLRSTPQPLLFPTVGGAAVLAFIVAMRRLGGSPGIAGTLAAVGLIGAVIVALATSDRQSDLGLRFAAAGPIAATARMIADAGPLGSGAGTFSALLPIYGSTEDIGSHASAPSAASALMIELGRPMWMALLVLAIAAAAVSFRAAMLRGRDSFYAATAAALIVVLVMESFVDSTLFNTAIAILAAATVGLGLGQSLGRTA